MATPYIAPRLFTSHCLARSAWSSAASASSAIAVLLSLCPVLCAARWTKVGRFQKWSGCDPSIPIPNRHVCARLFSSAVWQLSRFFSFAVAKYSLANQRDNAWARMHITILALATHPTSCSQAWPSGKSLRAVRTSVDSTELNCNV